MAGRTVQVRGFPAELPPDRAADKLTIHFLRSRNGGGEITDVRVLPGPQGCALITFEAPEVARRVLAVKDHQLSVGGKKFPLEVTAHVEELSPDEIFVRACMIVDYGKLPGGKSLLQDLLGGYSHLQFSFEPKNTHCIVKGPFTELQTFSGDLLGRLKPSGQAAGDALPPERSDRVREETAEASSSRGAVEGAAGEQPEDFSLVLDSDVYSYLQRFCAAEYQGVLRRCRVDAVDGGGGDGIAVLHLRPSAGAPRDAAALRRARLALQQLCQELEVSLCKETVSKRALATESRAMGALTRELQQLYPQLLCHEDEKQLYLIGSLPDVSRAKQHLQALGGRRGAAPPGTAGAAPHKPRAPAEPSAEAPGRLEPKGELKLAASFGMLRAGGSQSSQGHGEPAAATQQQQPPASAAAQPKDPEDQLRVKVAAELPRNKALPPLGGDEGGAWQQPDALKRHPLARSSSTCDRTKTSAALESPSSEARPLLHRSNSFSLPRAKEGAGAGGSVSEELRLDSLQWSYLQGVCRAAVEGLRGAGAVQLSERSAGGCTVLTLRAADRSALVRARWQLEALVQKCPDLVCQSVGYSELGVDGPEDGALSELCSLLWRRSLRIWLSKDRHGLSLAYPKELLPGVTEAFRSFSASRLRAPKSPGSESSGRPSVTQTSGSQDAAPAADAPGSPGSLQELNPSDGAELRAAQLPGAGDKRSPSPWRFQRALGQEEEGNDRGDSGAEPRGGSFPSPGGAERPSPAGPKEPREQPKRKLSGGERVLPDKFQLARDKSRGDPGEATGPAPGADGAPRSLPVWLHRAVATEPPEPGALQPPVSEPKGVPAVSPAGSSNAQEDPALPSPSLGQESHQPPPGQCDACRGSGATCRAPCGHALCRTCFAADRVRPACCSPAAVALSHRITGTFRLCSLSQSLPGYYRHPTLQVAYSIPDGVQGAGDPHPGQPYRGGNFFAFLPDNKDGQKTAVLLKKAFEQGLTFQIKPCDGEDRVTWGSIPHKTHWEGGKDRNGYPDSHYLQEVVAVLRSLGVA